jgi:signal transduction histidine kinase
VSSLVTLGLGWVGSELFFALYRLTVFQLPALVALVTTAATVRLAWRHRTREAAAVAAAFVVQCALGLHDALRIRGLLSADNPVLVPLSALLILLAFGYAVLRRYVGSLTAAEQSASLLDRQLAERTRELEASHARLREVEREHALAEERQRLMREMHDGMGSALTGSLLLVERGRLDSHAVAQVLRETIDELKLTVDSLEPLGGDLVPLLATLRYRLGQRLEDAGLSIRWNVGDLPALPWLDAAASLHVLRVLQEAFANVARHSQADTVRLETECDAQWVSVRIVDNGRGFDLEHAAVAGRGLRNMTRRMQALGGELQVASRPGETVVTIRLPRERRPGPHV